MYSVLITQVKYFQCVFINKIAEYVILLIIHVLHGN